MKIYKPGTQRIYQVQSENQSKTPLGSHWYTGAEMWHLLKSMIYFQIYKERGY